MGTTRRCNWKFQKLLVQLHPKEIAPLSRKSPGVLSGEDFIFIVFANSCARPLLEQIRKLF